MPYQPDWVGGKEVGVGERDHDARYKIIRDYLRTLNHTSFTVLDFGANRGYFSKRLVDDFSAKCTAVDSEKLLKASRGVHCIHYQMTPGGILKLPNYDVGLCLSVLHHHENWQQFFHALHCRCGRLFIETASPDEGLPHHQRIVDQHEFIADIGVLIGTSPGWNTTHERSIWVV